MDQVRTNTLINSRQQHVKAKPKLLLLCHRLPFPADKGDKIRSFNLMRELSSHFDLYLAALTEQRDELHHAPPLKQWCTAVKLIYLPRWQRLLQLAQALLTGKTITQGWFYSNELQKWVNQLQQQHPLQVLIYCSSMAQYVLHSQWEKTRKIIDYVDVDSVKWQQYADNNTGIKRSLYQREARLLAVYEQAICKAVQQAFFVSAAECERFTPATGCQTPISYYVNGVDLNYYYPIPNITPCRYDIVFTGAMDYQPNIEAMQWFVSNCWADIQQRLPNARLFIVGSNPASTVRKLATSHIIVTGKVPDVRPYLTQAALAIAPMRLGGGIKNKVLEAMAMATPLVLSQQAAQGLALPTDPALVIANTAAETISACLQLLTHPVSANQLRNWVSQHAAWSETTRPLLQALLAEEVA